MGAVSLLVIRRRRKITGVTQIANYFYYAVRRISKPVVSANSIFKQIIVGFPTSDQVILKTFFTSPL